MLGSTISLSLRAVPPQAYQRVVETQFGLTANTEPVSSGARAFSFEVITDPFEIYLPFVNRANKIGCVEITTDTTWTVTSSPYRVTCDVYVAPDATLTIEAGVRLLFEHTILEYGGNSGGMVYIASNAVQVLNSVVLFSADTGIYIQSASPLISATQILANTGSNGCGLYNDTGSPTIQNNTFTGDYAGVGGGLYAGSGSSSIQNNTFIGNAAASGGVVYNGSGDSQIIISNIVLSNTANTGGGIYTDSVTLELGYNVVWNNTGGDYGGITPGAHDISLDPLLVDPANDD